MGPRSYHLPAVAGHIAKYLASPDIVFLQEIQDNSGETDDGVVDADVTLNNLVSSIASSGGVAYNWTQISPVNDQDGGVPGGNIRPAYLCVNFKPFDSKEAYAYPVDSTLRRSLLFLVLPSADPMTPFRLFVVT